VSFLALLFFFFGVVVNLVCVRFGFGLLCCFVCIFTWGGFFGFLGGGVVFCLIVFGPLWFGALVLGFLVISCCVLVVVFGWVVVFGSCWFFLVFF